MRINKPLWWMLALCVAPIVLSYLTYYGIKPTGRSNYGTLLDPRAYTNTALIGNDIHQQSFRLVLQRGKWLMVMIDSGACDAACQEKLYQTRQIRTMLGKERERVERWWLITDQVIPSHDLIALHPDLKLLFVANKSLENLPLQPGATLADHVYLIDPRGHLMMRYPPKPDPMKIKKDLDKLLKASSIG